METIDGQKSALALEKLVKDVAVAKDSMSGVKKNPAALNGAAKVLIGTSRRGALHKVIKGSFQRQIESFLPPDIHVQVLAAIEPTAQPVASAKPSQMPTLVSPPGI